MIQFKLRGVSDNWYVVGVVGTPDDIYYTIHTDQYNPIKTYGSLRHLVKLYECANEEILSDEHPIRGGYSLEERNDTVTIELDPYSKDDPKPIETTYTELREALAPFLGDVFQALDSRSSGVNQTHSIEDVALNYSFLEDFRELYKSLTE